MLLVILKLEWLISLHIEGEKREIFSWAQPQIKGI